MSRLIVGTNPARTGDAKGLWRTPLARRPARVLCRAAGWIPPQGEDPADLDAWTNQLYSRFKALNIYERYHDTDEGFDPSVASLVAAELLSAYQPRVVVTLGRSVTRAFLGVRGAPYFVPAYRGDTMIMPVPHPSGRNRLLNDPDTVHKLGIALRLAERW